MNPKVYSLPEEKQSAIQGNVPASEACLRESIRRGCMDADAMEKDFRRLSEFWKMICLRKNREETGDERKDT